MPQCESGVCELSGCIACVHLTEFGKLKQLHVVLGFLSCFCLFFSNGERLDHRYFKIFWVIILSSWLNYHGAQLRLEKMCHRQPMSFELSTIFAVLLVENSAVDGAAWWLRSIQWYCNLRSLCIVLCLYEGPKQSLNILKVHFCKSVITANPWPTNCQCFPVGSSAQNPPLPPKKHQRFNTSLSWFSVQTTGLLIRTSSLVWPSWAIAMNNFASQTLMRQRWEPPWSWFPWWQATHPCHGWQPVC